MPLLEGHRWDPVATAGGEDPAATAGGRDPAATVGGGDPAATAGGEDLAWEPFDLTNLEAGMRPWLEMWKISNVCPIKSVFILDNFLTILLYMFALSLLSVLARNGLGWLGVLTGQCINLGGEHFPIPLFRCPLFRWSPVFLWSVATSLCLKLCLSSNKLRDKDRNLVEQHKFKLLFRSEEGGTEKMTTLSCVADYIHTDG